MNLKNILIGVAVLILVGMGVTYLQFNKAHRDIQDEDASINISAVELFQTYIDDEVNANVQYLDHVIEVTGVVAEVDYSSPENQMVVLQSNDDFFGVNVYFIPGSNLTGVEVGKEIVIKGHCTGGDALGVVISQSTLIKKK